MQDELQLIQEVQEINKEQSSLVLFTLLPSCGICKLLTIFTLLFRYCSPQYCFPTQEEVIGKVIDIVRNHVKNHPNTLVACGSYTIGQWLLLNCFIINCLLVLHYLFPIELFLLK